MGRFPNMFARQGAFKPFLAAALALLLGACSAERYRRSIDRTAYSIIEEKQHEALGRSEPFTITRASDQLRERLLAGQELPYAGPASFGTDRLEPIDHWPDDNYLDPGTPSLAPVSTNVPVLGLLDALQVAALNSREFQSSKESVFESALALDLRRDQFETTFAGLIGGNYTQDRTALQTPGGRVSERVGANAALDAVRRLKSGAQISLQLGWDLVRLLEPGRFTSENVFGDASISIPLLRGAGSHIVAEPLTQAERNVIYAIYRFERFKRNFAVNVAAEYLSVLQRSNEVRNAAENYRGLIASTRRAQRFLDTKGTLPAIQVDQAMQDELSARNRWVNAIESYASSLDNFKALLGLPPDSTIELDSSEFDRLTEASRSLMDVELEAQEQKEIPPADAPIELAAPTAEHAGRFEMDPEEAIRLALTNRLDLRIARGQVYDAQRQVVLAADALRPELTLLGRASFPAEGIDDLSFNTGNYRALLTLDPPFERTAEAIAYRSSFINLEQAVRDLQALEDEIKLQVRDRLRSLREARETVRIQALSVELAQRRVRGTTLMFQAGRVPIRDLLEAQEDLLGAQNSLTAAAVNYRVAELQLQRDLGVLEVNSEGLWTEYTPPTP